MSSETDVVVIGAGAAGLAAGVQLRRAGVRFRVLEASAAPGGRAATDMETLGTPFDLGCHWLHDARANPFVPIADALGFALGRSAQRDARLLHLGDRFATLDERAEARAAVDEAFDAVYAAGHAGRDMAASEVIASDGRWLPLARHWLSLMSAQPAERISTLDFSFYRDSDDNWPVFDGYGALVLAHAGALPLTLDCPVSVVDRDGALLRLETAQGTIRCKVAIVAVSTAVIAGGVLTFHPALPAELGEAFAALPLGVAEKVALAFDADVFGVPARTGLDLFHEAAPEHPALSVLLRPGGAAAAVVHLAGPAAGALAQEGEGAMVDLAAAALADVFGADLRRHLRRARVTRWAAMPYIGGAYSCALPGAGHLRARLHQTVDERIFFAGEALGGEAFSTCHGAHRSGIAAAEAALAALGGRT